MIFLKTALRAGLLLCLLTGTAHAQAAAPEAAPLPGVVEGIVKNLTVYLARFVEVAAALVIGIASIRGIGSYFVGLVRGPFGALPKEEIRLSLGRSLALALEFELGADILNTAVAPTWNEIGLLAAIAVLRTGLNYFLERELRNAEQRDPKVDTATGDTGATKSGATESGAAK